MHNVQARIFHSSRISIQTHLLGPEDMVLEINAISAKYDTCTSLFTKLSYTTVNQQLKMKNHYSSTFYTLENFNL